MDSQERFLFLLEKTAHFFGVALATDEAKKNRDGSADHWQGSLELDLKDERKIKIQFQPELVGKWDCLRLVIKFEKPTVDLAWTMHHECLEALLLCRVVPGSFFPIAPLLLPGDEIQWHALFPLNGEIENTETSILSIVEGAVSFYEELLRLVRDVGFCKELTMQLRSQACSSGLAWTLGEWERQKKQHPNASHAMETYSDEGHYYRLLPATGEVAGVMVINLGNLTDFVGIENVLPLLLQANAITFLSDNYYLGIDDREGLLLMALLPPAQDHEAKLLTTALLKRAVAVREFLHTMTNKFEMLRIQEIVRKQDPSDIEALVLT